MSDRSLTLITPEDATSDIAELASFRTVAEAAEWAQVPVKERLHVQEVARWMVKIADSRHKTRGAMKLKCGRALGVSKSTVNGWLKKWRDSSGNKLALVNRARVKTSVNLNPTFIAHWHELQGKHQRGNIIKQAWRQLMSDWRAWRRGDESKAIPGYAECPEPDFGQSFPAGWSESNLRQYKPDKYANALMKQGTKAASAFLPMLRRTRVGSLPGQFVLWDDHKGDHLILHPGEKDACCPVGFFCQDYTSGCIVNHWWKPALRRPVEGSRAMLTQQDFYWFLLHYLSTHGVRRVGKTTLVVEHGTAAIQPDGELENNLYALLGDKLCIDRSGRLSKPMRGMLYAGQGCGNFRHKANLESFFNLLENAMCALPGQSGRNPDEKPEEQYGYLRAAAQYQKDMLDPRLSDERKGMIIAPGMHFWDYQKLSREKIAELNARDDHKLEGWEKAGFCQDVFKIGGEFMTRDEILALPDGYREEAMIIAARPNRMSRVRLSPAAVWKQGTATGMRRLSAPEIASLVPENMLRTARVTDRYEFEIDDCTLGPDTMFYVAKPRDHTGIEKDLKRGETYQIVLNPHSFDRIQVLHASGQMKGAWIGECHEARRIPRADDEAAVRRIGEIQALTASHRAAVERMQLPIVLRRQTDKAHNARVKDTKNPLTPREIRAAAARAEAEAALTEFHREVIATGRDGTDATATASPSAHFSDDDDSADLAARADAALAGLHHDFDE